MRDFRLHRVCVHARYADSFALDFQRLHHVFKQRPSAPRWLDINSFCMNRGDCENPAYDLLIALCDDGDTLLCIWRETVVDETQAVKLFDRQSLDFYQNALTATRRHVLAATQKYTKFASAKMLPASPDDVELAGACATN